MQPAEPPTKNIRIKAKLLLRDLRKSQRDSIVKITEKMKFANIPYMLKEYFTNCFKRQGY